MLNADTAIVGICIAVILTLATYSVIKDKRKGGCIGCNGCCRKNSQCRRDKEKKD